MTNSIKLAFLVSIGPLDKFGYQHIYKPVIANLCSFATRVYLISSTRSRNGVDEMLNSFSNVVLVSNERTWLPIEENEQETYRIAKLLESVNLSIDLARSDGMDCVVLFSINQYLPEENRDNFLNDCTAMIVSNEPFRWLYKRIQLGNRLQMVDRRVPFILNLRYPAAMVIEADSLRLPNTEEYYRSTPGDFRDKSNISTVDVPQEMTPKDLEELRCFIRNYDEINPGVDPTYVWERDKWREVKKYSNKKFSTDPLSPTGKIIARNSRPDFVSQYLLKVHPANIPWYVRQGQRLKSWVERKPVFHRLKGKLKRGSK